VLNSLDSPGGTWGPGAGNPAALGAWVSVSHTIEVTEPKTLWLQFQETQILDSAKCDVLRKFTAKFQHQPPCAFCVSLSLNKEESSLLLNFMNLSVFFIVCIALSFHFHPFESYVQKFYFAVGFYDFWQMHRIV
jgi:hypothetical protein